MRAALACWLAISAFALSAGGALPAGHPSVVPTAASVLPPGHPPAPSASTLPPGHPVVAPDSSASDEEDDDASNSEAEGPPPGHTGMQPGEAPKDTVAAAPDLRPGTIEVHLADATGRAVPNFPVRLGVMRQDIAQGNSRDERTDRTDATGTVTFSGLPIGTDYSYRATAQQDGGVYASEPFRLDERTGQRALVHVYPVTRDIRQALVGMRGVIFVQPREDVFQVEATIQVLNIGAIAWVPDRVRIPLPDGAKAFRAGESMSDARVERDKDGDVLLLGTYSPGEHEVTFQFHLENFHEPSRRFRMGLPPHVAEMRVFAEGPRDMQLTVSGFPKAEHTTGQSGNHLLVTGRRAVRAEPPIDDVEVLLENIPVPSQGRWYAALLALGVAVFGVWGGLSGKRSNAEPYRAELSEAEELIFRELLTLERLQREGQIGPRAYADARSELLDVLSRLASRTARVSAPA